VRSAVSLPQRVDGVIGPSDYRFFIGKPAMRSINTRR
jgi:hypothetical protein